jgi:XTP/dITP diphosphohydrolase
MKIVLATNNKHKIEEIKNILSDSKLEILTLNDFPDFPKIEETGKTLEENAILKAKAIYRFAPLTTSRFASFTTSQFTKLITLADDTGLEVDALDGAPGVFSSRFAGEHCSYKDNNMKLLLLMENVPWEKRGATFVCVVAIAKDLENIKTVRGEVRGIIAYEEKGKSGFGYDPVFYLPELDKTFAQFSFEEKNKRSHRAKAFRKAKELIQKDFHI